MGLYGGTWIKANMAEFCAECHSVDFSGDSKVLTDGLEITCKLNKLRSESPYHKDSTTPRSLNRVLFGRVRTWMGDQIRIPHVVITFFSRAPFRRCYLRLQNSQPCVMSFTSISQLFVPHFAISAFTCIYLQHPINHSFPSELLLNRNMGGSLGEREVLREHKLAADQCFHPFFDFSQTITRLVFL